MRDDAAFAEDENVVADLLDDFENMRAVEDHLAAPAKARRRLRRIIAAFTSRPENGSSRMRTSGSWNSAAMRRIFWRIPLE